MDTILQHIPGDIDLDALTDALSCQEDRVCCLAGAALGCMGVEVERATERLCTILLTGEYSSDRQLAAVALEKVEVARSTVFNVDALCQDLLSDQDNVRARAAALLGSVGSADSISTAITALRSAMSDSSAEVRRIIIDAFERIGRPALPALIEIICLDDDHRYSAATAIKSIAEPVVPELMSAYEGCTADAKKAIIQAIGELHSNCRQAIPFLIDAIDDENVDVATNAIMAIEEFGPAAAAAVPRLIRALTGEYERYVELPPVIPEIEEESEAISWIAETLGAIGPSAKAAISYLMKLLDSEDYGIRQHVFAAVCAVGPSPSELNELIAFLDDEDDPCVRSTAFSSLCEMTLSDEDLRQVLEALLSGLRKGQEDMCRWNNCWRSIGSDRAIAFLPRLIKALSDPSPRVVGGAASLIAEIGIPAGSTALALVNAFGIADKDARCAIVSALGRTGNADQAVVLLREASHDDDDDIKCEWALAVGRTGVNSDEVLSYLRNGMINWGRRGRIGAAFALQKLDPTEQEAIATLMASFVLDDDYDYYVSSDAGSLLSEIGRPALPALLKGLHDPSLDNHALLESFGYSKLWFATREELAPTILQLLESELPTLRYRGVYLVESFGVDSGSNAIIERLWRLLCILWRASG